MVPMGWLLMSRRPAHRVMCPREPAPHRHARGKGPALAAPPDREMLEGHREPWALGQELRDRTSGDTGTAAVAGVRSSACRPDHRRDERRCGDRGVASAWSRSSMTRCAVQIGPDTPSVNQTLKHDAAVADRGDTLRALTLEEVSEPVLNARPAPTCGPTSAQKTRDVALRPAILEGKIVEHGSRARRRTVHSITSSVRCQRFFGGPPDLVCRAPRHRLSPLSRTAFLDEQDRVLEELMARRIGVPNRECECTGRLCTRCSVGSPTKHPATNGRRERHVDKWGGQRHLVVLQDGVLPGSRDVHTHHC